MDTQLLRELLDAHVDTTPVDRTRLPEIALYMDQVLALLDAALEPGRRSEKDKLLTKTMINNYTKEGLLQKPHGKKYSRAHVLMLVLIHQLKQTMSIEDIKALLALSEGELLDGDGYDDAAVAGLFAGFDRLKLAQEALVDAIAENAAEALPRGEEGALDTLLSVLYLNNLARMATLTAQKLLDAAAEQA